jgi:hypothetical protein
MKLLRTTLASAVLALSALSAAPVPANAYDPSASQNWSREAAKRAQSYNNIKPYNYNNRNSRRKRANRGRTYRPSRRRRSGRAAANRGNSVRGRDCTKFNGPYGYYDNPWCK